MLWVVVRGDLMGPGCRCPSGLGQVLNGHPSAIRDTRRPDVTWKPRVTQNVCWTNQSATPIGRLARGLMSLPKAILSTDSPAMVILGFGGQSLAGKSVWPGLNTGHGV